MLKPYMARLQELAPELERTEHKRQKVLEFMHQAPVICFLKEAETGKYEFISDKGLAVMGKSEAEVIGKTDWELFPQDTAKVMMEHDIRLLKERQEFVAFEMRTYSIGVSRLYLVARFIVENGSTSIGGYAIEIPDTFRLEPIQGRAA